jgi:hypothetical protein
MLMVDWTGWTALGDFAFIAGSGAAAYLTKRGAACLAASLLTASGTFGMVTGLLVRLGTSAPWLFLGTALALGVATFRGLPEEVADFVADLRAM